MSQALTPPPSEPAQQTQYTSGARQWLRRCSLVVSNRNNESIDLSDLGISFKINQNELQTPNTAWIKVFNPSPETIQRIRREFTRVSFSAGYVEGNYGTIFDGTVTQVRDGRDSAIDTYLEIAAADGDVVYNWAVISVTLAAGSTSEDVINAAMTAINQFTNAQQTGPLASTAPFTVTLGPVPSNLTQQRLPRGRVLHGMVRDVLRQVANVIGCNWSIQNRVLTFTPLTGYIEGDAVVLTSRTGLVRYPEQTQDGITATCLLNANLSIGRRVKIDNKSVQQARFDLSYLGEARNAMLPSIATDGMYRVLSVDWQGDTHGSEWYSLLTLLSLDPTAELPISQAQRGRILPP